MASPPAGSPVCPLANAFGVEAFGMNIRDGASAANSKKLFRAPNETGGICPAVGCRFYSVASITVEPASKVSISLAYLHCGVLDRRVAGIRFQAFDFIFDEKAKRSC